MGVRLALDKWVTDTQTDTHCQMQSPLALWAGGEKMFLVYCWSSLILEVPLEAGGGWGLY